MNNQEKIKSFLEELLQERLIFCSSRPKRDLSTNGAMYFIQETQTINNELYYVTNKSSFYPDGLVQQRKLLKMMQQHSKDNPILPHNLIMYPVGKWMGSTHCRCCGESLGNGGGSIVFEYQNKKYNFSLTGGADHYFEHNINLNLISYSWISKEKKIRIHTQFVGNVEDVHLIESFIQTLKPEKNPRLVLKNKI